jgi:hypothetical protein
MVSYALVFGSKMNWSDHSVFVFVTPNDSGSSPYCIFQCWQQAPVCLNRTVQLERICYQTLSVLIIYVFIWYGFHFTCHPVTPVDSNLGWRMCWCTGCVDIPGVLKSYYLCNMTVAVHGIATSCTSQPLGDAKCTVIMVGNKFPDYYGCSLSLAAYGCL